MGALAAPVASACSAHRRVLPVWRSEYEAKRYEGRLRKADAVSVHCDNSEWINRARKLLDRCGAQTSPPLGSLSRLPY